MRVAILITRTSSLAQSLSYYAGGHSNYTNIVPPMPMRNEDSHLESPVLGLLSPLQAYFGGVALPSS